MIRSVQLGLVLWLAGIPACQRGRATHSPEIVVSPGGAMELRLMSFNVRYENPGDSGPRAWSERVIGAVRMIRDEHPDVFGVQELLHGQAADLRASLPDYGFSGVGRDDGKRAGEYAGIFFRMNRFEPDFSDCGTFWLSDTPERPGSMTWGNGIPRVASWIRLTDRATRRGFYVFNTHWDHRHQESRERAARLLAERIDSRKFPDQPVVLLGDFNAVEKNPGVAYLTGRRVRLAGREQIWGNRLIDTFQSLHASEPDRTTLHFWKGSRGGSLKVDHIFVSAGAEVLAAEIRDRDRPMVSDHFPFTARVRFPE